MNSLKASEYEKKYGVLGIDSENTHVHYFIDGKANGIAIAGEKGVVGLTLEQAEIVAKELPEMIELAKSNQFKP